MAQDSSTPPRPQEPPSSAPGGQPRTASPPQHPRRPGLPFTPRATNPAARALANRLARPAAAPRARGVPLAPPSKVGTQLLDAPVSPTDSPAAQPDASAPTRTVPLPTAPIPRRPGMAGVPRPPSRDPDARRGAVRSPKRRLPNVARLGKLATMGPGTRPSAATSGGPKSRPPAPRGSSRGVRSAMRTLRDTSMPVSQRVTQAAGDVAQQAGARAIQALSGGVIPARWANRALGHLREHKKRYGLLLLAAIPGSILVILLALGMVMMLLFGITPGNGPSTNATLAGNLSTSVMGLTPTQVQLLNAGADWTAQHRGQAVDGVTVYASLPAAFLLADLLQESGGQQVPSATSPINWSQFASCPDGQGTGQFRCAQGGTSAMLARAQATIPTGGACQSLSWWQAHGVDCGGAAGPAQIQMTNSSSGAGSDTWASDVAHSALFKAIYSFMRSQVKGYSWPRTPNPWAFGYAVAAQITVLLGKEQAAVVGLGAGACTSSAQETLPSSQCLEWVAAYYNGSEFSAGIHPGSYGYHVGLLYAGLQPYTQKASVSLKVASSIVESAAQQTVLASAQSQIGVPYVWGGDTPGKAFDCSGLTKYVYSLVGVTLPHNAALQQQMAQQSGVFIASPNPTGPLSAAQLTRFEAQLAPGDLIFYDVPSDGSQQPGHVGVYVGGGEMIDAPATGQLVSLQPILNSAVGWPTGGAAFWKLAPSAQ